VSQLIKACGVIAETRSAKAATSPRIPIELDDPKNPTLGLLRLDPSQYKFHPVAYYHAYSKTETRLLLDEERRFCPESPLLQPLYFFGQYEYMVQRIDAFRAHYEQCAEPAPPGIAVIGTPGIGKSVWPLVVSS
jgi:hypothetical protein